eukprot:symbB.v1.2.027665.t1/scaffold2851.1/size68913/2
MRTKRRTKKRRHESEEEDEEEEEKEEIKEDEKEDEKEEEEESSDDEETKSVLGSNDNEKDSDIFMGRFSTPEPAIPKQNSGSGSGAGGKFKKSLREMINQAMACGALPADPRLAEPPNRPFISLHGGCGCRYRSHQESESCNAYFDWTSLFQLLFNEGSWPAERCGDGQLHG